MRLIFLISLLFAGSAVAAQSQRAVVGAIRPAIGDSAAGAPFTTTCVDILRLVGGQSSFSFMCRQSDGGVQMFTVAKGEDNTGNYPVGHDPQTGTALSNLYGMTAISQTVVAFTAVKSVKPDSPAVLQINGFSSKLPAANGAPVVTSATLVMN